MNETAEMLTLLRQSVISDVIDAIEVLIAEAPDRALCRISAVAFAAKIALMKSTSSQASCTELG